MNGESTANLAPYAGLPPALRRPDAIGQIPVCPAPVALRSAAPSVPSARPALSQAGQGRHRAAAVPRSFWHDLLVVELVAVAVLAIGLIYLVVTR